MGNHWSYNRQHLSRMGREVSDLAGAGLVLGSLVCVFWVALGGFTRPFDRRRAMFDTGHRAAWRTWNTWLSLAGVTLFVTELPGGLMAPATMSAALVGSAIALILIPKIAGPILAAAGVLAAMSVVVQKQGISGLVFTFVLLLCVTWVAGLFRGMGKR